MCMIVASTAAGSSISFISSDPTQPSPTDEDVGLASEGTLPQSSSDVLSCTRA